MKGSIVGTVTWMAPEILDKYSHFSDLGDLKMKELVRYYQIADAFSMGATIAAAANLYD